jgi:putative methanogenesis marker protein 8
MQDEHVWEALGKARIVVRDGKVVEVGEPQLKYCPIFDKFRGIKELTCDAIRENMQFRIDDFGMCRADRKLRMWDYPSFGISEMIHTAMENDMVDAAVIDCEGCGTVIIDEPDMVQGIGGRVSGLVSTTPIPGLIKRIGPEKVLDRATAKIDQVAGVKKVIAMGYKNIAASTTGAGDARRMKSLERESTGE